MDIENIKRKNIKTGPKVNINIKVSQNVSKWLKQKNYSPTGIFHEALKEVGCPLDSIESENTETEESTTTETPENAE